jgi:uncharacterized membrane protein
MRRRVKTALLMMAYLLLGSCGLLALLIAPSRSLSEQGGGIFVIAWSAACLLGGLGGVLGVALRWRVIEVFGSFLGAIASLAWVVALVLQAIKTHEPLAVSAACMIAMIPVLLAQRWAEVRRL